MGEKYINCTNKRMRVTGFNLVNPRFQFLSLFQRRGNLVKIECSDFRKADGLIGDDGIIFFMPVIVIWGPILLGFCVIRHVDEISMKKMLKSPVELLLSYQTS